MGEQKIFPLEHISLFKRTLCLLNQLAPGITLMQFLQTLCQAFLPFIGIYMSAKILDEMAGGRDVGRLVVYVGITIGAALVTGLLRGLFGYFLSRMSVRLDANQEMLLTSKTYALPHEMVEDREIIGLRKLIESNNDTGVGGLYEAWWFTNNFFRYACTVCIAIAMGSGMFVGARWWMVAALVLLVLAAIWIMCRNRLKVNRTIRKLYEALTDAKSLYDFYMVDYMDDSKAAKDIRIFGQSHFINKELHQKMYDPLYNARISQVRTEGNHSVLTIALTALLGGIVYVFVALQAWEDRMSVGDVLRYYGSITQLISASASLIVACFALCDNNYSMKLLFRYLDLPEQNQGGGKAMENKPHAVEFRDVSFCYSPGLHPALEGVSLRIESGEHVAIVGRNGSGKTTLVKLLCRLYAPTQGVVAVDSTNVWDYDFDEYQRNIAAVFQDFKLFSFGVGQNVAGRVDFDPGKVWDALELAGLKKQVKSLARGLEQTIYKDFEEDGVEFSGGEEQKLAIARALYKDAPILILDEPTAALDPFSEEEIYEKFGEIAGGKTVIYISHRLSSCKFCDRIIVLDKGKIVQNGTHDDLLSDSDGVYARLWNAQAQYYLKEASNKNG